MCALLTRGESVDECDDDECVATDADTGVSVVMPAPELRHLLDPHWEERMWLTILSPASTVTEAAEMIEMMTASERAIYSSHQVHQVHMSSWL